MALGGLASGFGMGAGRCLPRYDHRHDPPTHDHTPTVRPGGFRAPPGRVPLGVAWSHGSGCLCLLEHCAVITPHPPQQLLVGGWLVACGGAGSAGGLWLVVDRTADARTHPLGVVAPERRPPKKAFACVRVCVAWLPACSLPPPPLAGGWPLLPCPLFFWLVPAPLTAWPRAGVGSCCVRLLLVPVSSSSRLTPPGAACFHIWPINPVVYWEPSTPPNSWGGVRRPYLGVGFPLRCFQRLPGPNVANQPCPWRDNWRTRGSSVPVLSY